MQRDLVVSFLSAMKPEVAGMFTRRPLELVCPVTQGGGGGYPGGRQGYQMWLSQFKDLNGNVIPGMFKKAGLSPGDTMGRVLVMGFSNGCIGVDETLRANDSVKIDCVLAVDGIHGAYTHASGKKELNAASYKRFLNHGVHVLRRSADDTTSPVMVVTHSSIVPPGFPSTTETADFIWEKVWPMRLPGTKAPCSWPCIPAVHENNLALVYQAKTIKTTKAFTWSGFADGWYDRRIANNFAVWGWGDLRDGAIVTRDPAGTADHIFQGQFVLHELIKEFAVRRWNVNCGVVVATAGLGDEHGQGAGGAGVVCKPGAGLVYDYAAGEKVDYFPELPESAPPVPKCPPPPPGHVIVGGDTPCATAPIDEPGGITVAPPIPIARTRSAVGDALLFGVGALAGYAGIRWVIAPLRRR